MDWLWDILKIAAPIAGQLIAPGIGGVIGSGVAGLIGSIQGQNAANEAEQRMNEAAMKQYQLAQQALDNINMGSAVRTLSKQGLSQLGGSLAASGLLGSSLGSAAMRGVVADVLARIAPQQTSAMLQATSLAMQPYGGLLNAYSNAGLEAAKTSGLDLSALPWDQLGGLNIDWSKIFGSPTAGYAYYGGAGF